MKRSAILRNPDGSARLSVPALRPKVCKGCRQRFTPLRQMQSACSPACAEKVGKERTEKAAAKVLRDDKRQTRETLEAMKTAPQLTKEAQREFNAYIRLRDVGQPCICCGEFAGESARGGDWDAGHYRSVGSAPHLRFDPRNVHRQTKRCNRFGAGRAVDYRIGLIARIGLAEVEALEADQAPRKQGRDELREIRDRYRSLVRVMKGKA